jgi:hypothetical protein
MPDGTQFTAARFAVTIFADQTASTKWQRSCTLEEIAQNIRTKRAPDKTSLPWLKLAEFGEQRTSNNCLRSNANVVSISGVEGDYDGGPLTSEDAVAKLYEHRIKAVLYTTPSNTDEKPHWRVLCPTSAPLPPTARAELVDRVNGVIGGGLAPESWVLSQAYYFGSVDDGRPPVQVEIVDGPDCGYLDQRDDIAPISKPGSTAKESTAKESTAAPRGSAEAPIVDLDGFLSQIRNDDRPWEEWNTILLAIYAASSGSSLGMQLAVEWSEKSAKHKAGAVEARWAHYRTSPPTRIGAGMLRRMAADQAWINVAAEYEQDSGGPFSSAAPDDGSPFLLTEADIYDMPDPIPLVEGMLMQNENICLVGPPKSGKTFVALDIALSITAGEPVLGKLPVKRQGAVVYLTAEGKAGFKRRIKAWRQARKIDPGKSLPFYFKAAVPMTAQGATEAKIFVGGIRGQVGGPVLVIVDTMARSLGIMNENDASSASAYLNLTEEIRAGLDTTLLTLAHASDKPGAALQIRGSSGFGAGFDSVWTLRMDKSNRTAKMAAFYMKDGDESDFGPFCFRMQSEYVQGMENGKGAVLTLVPNTEWNTSGETSSEDQRCAYLREALEAARGRKFSTAECAQYLVEWDMSLAGAGERWNESNEQHQLQRRKREDFLKNGARPRPRKGQESLPGYFAEFFDEHILGAPTMYRVWRAAPEVNPW